MFIYRNHWKLGIIEKPREFMDGNMWSIWTITLAFNTERSNRVLHILDSLPTSSPATIEAQQLQAIFLKHFENAVFQEGRVATNVAQVFHLGSFINFDWSSYTQVPHQGNGKDCGCFAIYFARKFLQDPVTTLRIIKVCFFFLPEDLWSIPIPDSVSFHSR